MRMQNVFHLLHHLLKLILVVSLWRCFFYTSSLAERFAWTVGEFTAVGNSLSPSVSLATHWLCLNVASAYSISADQGNIKSPAEGKLWNLSGRLPFCPLIFKQGFPFLVRISLSPLFRFLFQELFPCCFVFTTSHQGISPNSQLNQNQNWNTRFDQ